MIETRSSEGRHTHGGRPDGCPRGLASRSRTRRQEKRAPPGPHGRDEILSGAHSGNSASASSKVSSSTSTALIRTPLNFLGPGPNYSGNELRHGKEEAWDGKRCSVRIGGLLPSHVPARFRQPWVE